MNSEWQGEGGRKSGDTLLREELEEARRLLREAENELDVEHDCAGPLPTEIRAFLERRSR